MTNTAKFGMSILTCALITGSGIAAQARAQAAAPPIATDTAQQTVQLGDLDLTARAGQAIARRRLLVAVHVTCDAVDAGANDQPAEQGCQTAALSDAREELARLTLQISQAPIRLAGR